MSTKTPKRPAGSRSTRVALLLLAALAISIGGCAKDEAADRPEADQRLPVDITTVATTSHRDAVSVSGRIEAFRDARLAAEASGRVTRRVAIEGSLVEAGAVLLEVDDARPRLERDRAAVALEEMRLDPSIPAATRRARELDLSLAEDRLARCFVRAPFAGRLESYSAQIGDWVRIGDPVARLVDENDLRIRVRVAGEAALRFRVGSTARFRLRSLGERWFPATLVRLGRAADEQDGLYEVELRITPETTSPVDELRVGMIATLELVTETPRSLVILPRRAAFRRFEERLCWVAVPEGTRLLARERALRVRSLAGQARDWEVLDGLSVGDRVILGPFVGLADGVEVAPRQNADAEKVGEKP